MNKSLLLAAVPFVALPLHAKQKPNMVIYIADDHGYQHSPVYGDNFVRTPHMAQLAADGMTFDKAYVASPCSGPSRGALLSSMYNIRNGAIENHQAPKPETQQMVKTLQKQGYEVVAIGKIAHGKVHAKMQGFDYVLDASHENLYKEVVRYIDQRTSEKPLCLLVGNHNPHVPWAEKSIYNADDIQLPNYFVNTPETRNHYGRYLTDVTDMDCTMGKVDTLMQNYFGNDDFLFLYTADHGAQLPFGKFTLYESGVRTPLIVRWKGNVKPNVRTDAMVSWLDIFPTLIDIAGGKSPDNIDGESFAKVLKGKKDTHREDIYTVHTADGGRNVFPTRAVRYENFKYIRNLKTDVYFSNHSDILRKNGAGAYWWEWEAMAKIDPKAAEIVARYQSRPAEELFDLAVDPFEQNNLALDLEYQDIKKQMSLRLDKHLSSTNDNWPNPKAKHFPLSGLTPYEANKQKLIVDGIRKYDKAVHITEDWIRDPYIVLSPVDGYYYLTGTTPDENDKRELTDYYNIGLGKTSIVGSTLRVWRSLDLKTWEYLGVKNKTSNNPSNLDPNGKLKNPYHWAPELHFDGDRWLYVHCPNKVSTFAVSESAEIDGKWKFMNPAVFANKHDPSLFKDDDGTWYFIFNKSAKEKKVYIAPLKEDFSGFASEPVELGPKDRSLGHEGATLMRIEGKYVLFGTGWSTDQGRKGSYNLYYCTADSINGPFSERRFAGRFLGHGTPFKDKLGRWWCTAFFNANVIPLEPDKIQKKDLSETAQTINRRGTTLVPMKVEKRANGDVFIRAIPPAYAQPGPDEVRK